MDEIRVGYATSKVLYDIAIDYIRAHTANGRFEGNPMVLSLAHALREYLYDDKFPESEVIQDKVFGD